MEYIISHHGIRGQKWGIRNYQNPDGSLTEEGRERYYGSSSDDYVRSREIAKKKPNEMTNAEMRAYNERRQLEENYSRNNPGAYQRGKKLREGDLVEFNNNSVEICK